MFGSILLSLKAAINSCWGWFLRIISVFDGFAIFFVVIFSMYCGYRFILKPFLAEVNLGSDKAMATTKWRYSKSKTPQDNIPPSKRRY